MVELEGNKHTNGEKPDCLQVFHGRFNLDSVDNIDQIPEVRAVYGIFAIVHEEPINCRFIGKAENLRESIKLMFESAPSEGLTKFMQGPWYKMILFKEVSSGDSAEVMEGISQQWIDKYDPKIDEVGDYPGYYDY